MTRPRTPEEVGQIVRNRIDELDLSKAEIERRGGPSGRTVGAYMDGAPIKDKDKRRTLSRALEWTGESIRRIQEGGDPTPQPWVDETPSDDIAGLAERAVSIINELARRASARR